MGVANNTLATELQSRVTAKVQREVPRFVECCIALERREVRGCLGINRLDAVGQMISTEVHALSLTIEEKFAYVRRYTDVQYAMSHKQHSR